MTYLLTLFFPFLGPFFRAQPFIGIVRLFGYALVIAVLVGIAALFATAPSELRSLVRFGCAGIWLWGGFYEMNQL